MARSPRYPSAHKGMAILRGRGNNTITLKCAGDRVGDDNDTIPLKAASQVAFGGSGNDTFDASASHRDYFVLELANGVLLATLDATVTKVTLTDFAVFGSRVHAASVSPISGAAFAAVCAWRTS